jgi:UDP-glucose 4-epimerase
LKSKLNILITGSSGFFGSILFKQMFQDGHFVIALDLEVSDKIPKKNQILCNLCDYKSVADKLANYNFDVIIHLAAQIDFAINDQKLLYKNNTKSTKNIAEYAKKSKVKRLIFTSSNSIFLGLSKGIIMNSDLPCPADYYGKSKRDSEIILSKYKKDFYVNILRCPNIIDSGRVGMLSILFELLKSNSTLWVLDNGRIKHQCLYAQDLISAITKLLTFNKSITLNIGSDNVLNFYDVFTKLILRNGSKSKIRSLPIFLILPLMKLLYLLGLSPLGPYQFRMLTKNFEFDLTTIKKELNWLPSKDNFEMLQLAYSYYLNNFDKLKINSSANSSKINMGVLHVLKYIKW